MSDDLPDTRYRKIDAGEIIGRPSPEHMVEVLKQLHEKLEAMSFEERAAYEWEKLQNSIREDERIFAGKSPEEVAKILDMRDDFHSRIRTFARKPGSRPILLRVDRDRFGFPLSGGPEAIGAEAALDHVRKLRQRRPKPRADGW